MADPDAGVSLGDIHARQEEILHKLDRGKDRWDKFSVLTTFVASVVLVVIGGIFTYSYRKAEDAEQKRGREQQVRIQQDQTRVQELQAVAALMPYLTSEDEDTKRQAFLALNELAPTGIGPRLAALAGGEGAIAAIRTIALSPVTPTEQKDIARQLLTRLEAVPLGGAPGTGGDTVASRQP